MVLFYLFLTFILYVFSCNLLFLYSILLSLIHVALVELFSKPFIWYSLYDYAIKFPLSLSRHLYCHHFFTIINITKIFL